MTIATTELANIPLAADAVRVHEWDDTQTLTPLRSFVGSSRVVDRPHHDTDIDVYLAGIQDHDGSASRGKRAQVTPFSSGTISEYASREWSSTAECT